MRPHVPRSTVFRPSIGALVTLTAALSLGCQRAEIPQTAVPEAARAGDAAKLPAFETASEQEHGEPSGIERFKVALGDAPVRGPTDAPVTIVMFSDFECPFCERGHQTLEALQKRYRGKIRVAYKAYPLDNHSNALLAAMAARSAQAQGKFWAFHDLLFSQRGLDVEQLLEYAREVDLDVEALERDLDSLEYGPEVRREMRQGRKLGVSSTPTFFINGRPVTGAKPFEDFAGIIDEELELTTKWHEQGVPLEAMYEHATRDGFTEVVYRRRSRGIDPDGVFPVPLGSSPQRGPDDAPVTIVTFGDFECPFCARGNRTIERLREHYGDKLRFVHKHSPLSFHSHAFIAARASLAAHAQGKFWAYHDALYRLEADFDEDDLVAIAKKIGLNMREFHKAMNSAELDERIEADQDLAMALGVTGTPAYFVNGRPIEGALPELQFRLLVEEELDRAAVALDEGIAPGELYETLTHRPLD